MNHRTSNLSEEPLRQLGPLTGFFKEFGTGSPAFGFRESMAAVVEGCRNGVIPIDVEELESNIEICEEFGRDQKRFGPPTSLSESEIAAIALYTCEFGTSNGSFYTIMNSYLRAADRNALKPFIKIIWMIMHGLKNSPAFDGKLIYRGVRADVSSAYDTDRTVIWNQFSSCTKSIEVQTDDLFCGQNGTRTLFNIELSSQRARLLQHSMVPSEQEVILPPNTRLKVVSKFNAGGGLVIIQLLEQPALDPILKFVNTPAGEVGSPPPSASSSTVGVKSSVSVSPSIVVPPSSPAQVTPVSTTSAKVTAPTTSPSSPTLSPPPPSPVANRPPPVYRMPLKKGSIRISGTTGVRAREVDGVYEPTNQMCDGQPVYNKRENKNIWIEYRAKSTDWNITNERGGTGAYAYVDAAPNVKLEDVPNMWRVATGNPTGQGPAHLEQTSVTVALASTRSIRIRGATGPRANDVNGVYEPLGESACGLPVYRKRENIAIFIEYRSSTSDWNLTTERGSTGAIAYVNCPAKTLLEDARECWKVSTGTGHADQASVTVSMVCLYPIRITGASGPRANEVNGIFEPSAEVSGGMTVFVKRENPAIFIEYRTVSSDWNITNELGGTGAYAYVGAPGYANIEDTTCVWKVGNGTGHEDQAKVKVSLTSFTTVQILGATGPRANEINGIFAPDGQSAGGMPVYKKLSPQNIYIEYREDSTDWNISPELGSTGAYGYVSALPRTMLEDVCQIWKVGTGASAGHEDQESVVVVVTSTHQVRISGATGARAKEINGTYAPMSKLAGGMPVYQKIENAKIYIEYRADSTDWNITPELGGTGAYAYVKAPLRTLIEHAHETWKVSDGTTHNDQASVVVSLSTTQPIRISGTVGSRSNEVNGIYEPTEEQSGLMPVYRKRSTQNIFLEYRPSTADWNITPTRGSNGVYAYCKAPKTMLDEVRAVWKIGNGTIHEEQSSVQVSLAAIYPVRIAGATGLRAGEINGLYEPTEEVQDHMPVFKKLNSTSPIWLEYRLSTVDWNVTGTRNSQGAHAYVKADSRTLIANVDQVWKVATAESHADQTSVMVSIGSTKAIRIAGATGTRASEVNGTYDPTDEVAGSMPVYKKRDNSSLWLEYRADSSDWNITTIKGSTGACAYVLAPARTMPELVRGCWKVFDGTVHADMDTVTISAI